MFNVDILCGGKSVSASKLNGVVEYILEKFQNEELPLTIIKAVLTEVENELEARVKL